MDRNEILWAISQVHAALIEGGHVTDRRERIATAAMQGLLAQVNADTGSAWDCAVLADEAVACADALIAALDKPAAEPSKAGA